MILAVSLTWLPCCLCRYDHTPFAFMWVFFSIIGVFLFRGVLSFMGKVCIFRSFTEFQLQNACFFPSIEAICDWFGACTSQVPTVVARQEELVGIIHKNTVEVSMVVKGLAPSVVKALETVYGQLDKNPIFRVQQVGFDETFRRSGSLAAQDEW